MAQHYPKWTPKIKVQHQNSLITTAHAQIRTLGMRINASTPPPLPSLRRKCRAPGWCARQSAPDVCHSKSVREKLGAYIILSFRCDIIATLDVRRVVRVRRWRLRSPSVATDDLHKVKACARARSPKCAENASVRQSAHYRVQCA